jgi:hypothetical protein
MMLAFARLGSTVSNGRSTGDFRRRPANAVNAAKDRPEQLRISRILLGRCEARHQSGSISTDATGAERGDCAG